MVAIAQLVEHLIVVQKVAGSSLVGHPIKKTLPVSEGSFSLSAGNGRQRGQRAKNGQPPVLLA